MDDIDKIRQSFYVEAEEIIESLEALLLDMENSPDDEEILNAVFRNIHTLKGSSGICELHSLERISHLLEDLLENIRSRKISCTDEIVDCLFDGLDTVKLVFEQTRDGSEVDDTLYEQLSALISPFLPEKEEVEEAVQVKIETKADEAYISQLSDEAKKKVASSVEEAMRVYQICVRLEETCMSMGTDPLLLIKSLGFDGEVLDVKSNVEKVPALKELDPVKLYIDEIKLIYASLLGLDEVNEIFEFARAVGEIEVHQFLPVELEKYFDVEFDDFWLDASTDEGGKETPLSDDILDPAIFFDEGRTILSEVNRLLTLVEEGDVDDDCIETLFRSFHTISGNAKMFGFSEISSIAGFSETILDKIRSGNVDLSKQTASILKDAADEIKDFIFMREEKKLYEAEVPDMEGEAVKRLGDILIEMGELTRTQLDEALKNQDKPLGEILVKTGVVREKKVEKALEKQKALSISAHAAIRVDTSKLDNLVNMVGELVITQTMLNHNQTIKDLKDSSLIKIITQLDKITREVQDNVMSIRMLPIKATFQKLIRLARDISKKKNKIVNIRVEGEDTELDKTVIDEIGDPLVHIVRNAIDHGIETPDERSKSGKEKTGIVELRAFHQGGNIVIQIKDDGRGLDRQAILNKALEKGLISNKEGHSDEEIFGFIFLPGFSTAKVVTDVSGRGVGMDVVKKNIDKLRGKVEIKSELGEGSTFTIKLPLTLAVIDGMVVKVGKEKFILPTISIVESIRPEKSQVSTVQGRGELVNFRGNLFPLVRLHKIFNIKPENENPWEAMVIQVEGEGKTVCLLVDELVGQQQVVIKSLGESFKNISCVSGGAIMGDGRVGLILDTGGIISITT